MLISHLPPDCALQRATTEPENVGWDLHTMLLAAAVDALHAANWQRGGDKSAKKPQPIPRPGVRRDDTVGEKYGTARPLEEVRSIFERRRAAQHAAWEALRKQESGAGDEITIDPENDGEVS